MAEQALRNFHFAVSLMQIYHFDCAIKMFENRPRIKPVTRPLIKRTGAIYFVLSPKIIRRATPICAMLLASAPARHKPTADRCFDLPSAMYSTSISMPLAKEPAAENTKIYEKKVPEINPCARTLRRIRNRVSRFLNRESDSKTGRFASPSRKNGSGFGIAYSTAERNIHKAAKNDISFVRLLSGNMAISVA